MKRGPAPKPDAIRQRRNAAGLTLGVVPLEQRPLAKRGWLLVTKREWHDYWARPIASLAARFGVAGAFRLFDLRDERERSLRAYRRKREWIGSMQQPKVSGHLAAMLALDRQIEALEDRYGLNPDAATKLGLQLLGLEREWEEAAGPGPDPDDVGDLMDPRLTA